MESEAEDGKAADDPCARAEDGTPCEEAPEGDARAGVSAPSEGGDTTPAGRAEVPVGEESSDGAGEDGVALEAARAELTAREAELASASRKLTELRAEVKVLRAFATGQVAAAREELPETLLAFDPGEEAGLEARLAWLATAREQAGKVTRAATPGAGEDPPPAGAAAREIPSPVPLRNMF